MLAMAVAMRNWLNRREVGPILYLELWLLSKLKLRCYSNCIVEEAEKRASTSAGLKMQQHREPETLPYYTVDNNAPLFVSI